MATPVYELHRPLSIRRDPTSSDVIVGLHPPHAIRITAHTDLVAAVIAAWDEPTTAADALVTILTRRPNDAPEVIVAVICDLVALGILREVVPRESPYDRHELYFSFFGLARSAYAETLQHKRVGLVGCGGIGSTAALLLAAAGIGALTISDGDVVEESNLTRAILFDRGDIGRLKVQAAADHLAQRAANLKVYAVPHAFSGPQFLEQYFADCDMLLLSADRPDTVQTWTDQAAATLGVPYINAGYSELFGSVGPFVKPGVSPCYECNRLYGHEERLTSPELNPRYQAPSYGPLNTLVAAITVNEVLRYLLGLHLETSGRRLLIDSSSYKRLAHDFSFHPECPCRDAGTPAGPAVSETLASHYSIHRDVDSLNALVLDDLILNLILEVKPRRVIDIGCGSGTIALQLATRGVSVTAVDSSEDMLSLLCHRLTPEMQEMITTIRASAEELIPSPDHDCVLLNMVLDHLDHPERLLENCKHALTPNGRLIVAVPHPFKDSGRWNRTRTAAGWQYDDFNVEDYFVEGRVSKHREDDDGNIVIPEIRTYKRTLQTWFSLLSRAGFNVEQLHEPQALAAARPRSTNFAKASRLPYFLVLVCTPSRH